MSFNPFRYINPANYVTNTPRKLSVQNQAGYRNMGGARVPTGDSEKDKPNVRAIANRGGADGSSIAQISAVRYDTVPLIRNDETWYWYGRKSV